MQTVVAAPRLHGGADVVRVVAGFGHDLHFEPEHAAVLGALGLAHLLLVSDPRRPASVAPHASERASAFSWR